VTRDTYALVSGLREEVRREQLGGDTIIESDVAVVGRLHDGHLEAAWVAQVDVDGAVLGLVFLFRSRSDESLEAVEAEGNDASVVREDRADGALRASVAAVGRASNRHFVGDFCDCECLDWGSGCVGREEGKCKELHDGCGHGLK
jgi:hypothetical protein